MGTPGGAGSEGTGGDVTSLGGGRSALRRLQKRLSGTGVGAILARGASGALTAKVAAAGLGFGLHLFLARALGAEPYGVYTYAFAWLVLAAGLSRLGFMNAVVRFVADYMARGDWERARGVHRHAFRWVLGVSLAIAALGAVALKFLAPRLGTEVAAVLAVGLGLLPILALVGIHEAAIRGLQRPVVALLPDPVVRPLGTGLFVGAALALGFAPSARTAMVATIAAAGAALLFASSALRRVSPAAFRRAPAKIDGRREWSRVALPMWVSTTMNTVRRRADVLMIGLLIGPMEAGLYTAALRFADFLLFALHAVNGVTAPLIAGLFAQGRTAQIQRVTSLAAGGVLVFALPLAGGFVLFGKPLLELFGEPFRAAYGALLWLAAGQIVNAATGSVGVLMAMTGQQKAAAAIVTASALGNVVLNALLIPAYGISGAGAATAATIALGNLAMLGVVLARLGINPTVLGLLRRRVGVQLPGGSGGVGSRGEAPQGRSNGDPPGKAPHQPSQRPDEPL